MKYYICNQTNLDKKTLTPFCEVFAEGDTLIFINRITALSVRKKGNPYVSKILADKLNSREDINSLSSLLSVWRSDCETVTEELTKEGYFE